MNLKFQFWMLAFRLRGKALVHPYKDPSPIHLFKALKTTKNPEKKEEGLKIKDRTFKNKDRKKGEKDRKDRSKV